MALTSGCIEDTFIRSSTPPKYKKIISTEEKVKIILQYYREIPAKLFRTYYDLSDGEFLYSMKDDLAGKYSKKKEKAKNLHPTDKQYVWLLDAYIPGDYSGEGERIGIRDDGKLVYGYTSHCSCNGPWYDEDGEIKIKSSSKLTKVEVSALAGLDWGPSYVENVDTLWAIMVKKNPWMVPLEDEDEKDKKD